MKKLVFLVLFLPALSFAGDLRVSVVDKDLDFPLEGAKISYGTDTVEADEDGKALLHLLDSVSEGTITVSFPGYKQTSVNFNGTDEEIEVELSLSSVIEGKELVVFVIGDIKLRRRDDNDGGVIRNLRVGHDVEGMTLVVDIGEVAGHGGEICDIVLAVTL